MLKITKAIPIGRKAPISPLNMFSIMNIKPLIEKSIAAVLYVFIFLDVLLFTMRVPIYLRLRGSR